MIHVSDPANALHADDVSMADQLDSDQAFSEASFRESLHAEGFGDLWRPIEDWQVD